MLAGLDPGIFGYTGIVVIVAIGAPLTSVYVMIMDVAKAVVRTVAMGEPSGSAMMVNLVVRMTSPP